MNTANVAPVTLSWLLVPFFLLPLCFIVVLWYRVTSSQRWKTTPACCLKGQGRASASTGWVCEGGRGADRMGSRWRWFRPISTTEGGLKMATGPPLPLTAFRETPYHLSSTTRFLTPPPSSSSPTPNHTILDAESIIWILTVQLFVPRPPPKKVAAFLKMRRAKIRFWTIGCDLCDAFNYQWGFGVSRQLVWEITFSSVTSLASPLGSCSE